MRRKGYIFGLVIIAFAAVVAIVGYAIHPRTITPLLFFLTTIVGCLCFYVANVRFSFSKQMIAAYYSAVVPLQLGFALLSPDSIISMHYNKRYDSWLFYDTGVAVRYVAYSILFLVIAFTMIDLAELIGRRKKIVVFRVSTSEASTTIKYSNLLLLFASCFYLWLQQGSLREYVNGYISYFFHGVLLFCYANAIVSASYDKNIISEIFNFSISIIIYSIPGIITGQRVYLIYALMTVLFFFLLTQGDDFGKIKAIVKNHLLMFTVVAILLFVAFGVISYIKFGVFAPARFFISRITGLFDGSVVLKYLESKNVNLGAWNYILSAYDDAAMRADKYYTNYIIGFPITAATGCAAPIFIISLLYGPIGMILICVAFTYSLGLFSKRITILLAEYQNSGRKSSTIRYKVLLLSYVMVIFLQHFYLDGNVEILKVFCTPLVAYCLFLLKSKAHLIKRN